MITGGKVIRRLSAMSDTARRLIQVQLYCSMDSLAKVVKLVDTQDLGSCGATLGGSSPPFRILSQFNDFEIGPRVARPMEITL